MKWAFALNFIFACLELVGGFWTNSMAIISDAIHDFGDALSLAIGIWLESKSHQKGNNLFSYGYRRLSLLAALFTGGVLCTGSVLVFVNSVNRLFHPEPVQTGGMIVFAIIGVLVNGLAFFKLKGDGHSHSHAGHSHSHHFHHHTEDNHSHDKHDSPTAHADCDHGPTKAQNQDTGNRLHQRMWELHFIEDLAGWVIVLIGAIAMQFYDLPWLDSAMAIALSVWIFWNVIRGLRATLVILLQGVPSHELMDRIEKYFHTDGEVQSVHHLHLWSLDGEKHILTGHVVLAENISLKEVSLLKSKFKSDLRKLFQVHEATLEFEWTQEDCSDPHHKN